MQTNISRLGIATMTIDLVFSNLGEIIAEARLRDFLITIEKIPNGIMEVGLMLYEYEYISDKTYCEYCLIYQNGYMKTKQISEFKNSVSNKRCQKVRIKRFTTIVTKHTVIRDGETTVEIRILDHDPEQIKKAYFIENQAIDKPIAAIILDSFDKWFASRIIHNQNSQMK